MVEMSGDPVAAVQGRTDGELSAARVSQIRAGLKKSQDRVKSEIQDRGGKVLSQMQSAYNGMRVTLPVKQVRAVSQLDGVQAIKAVPRYTLNNTVSVPFLGVPGVWQNSKFRGEGVKVGIIDTGIDYTHADFRRPRHGRGVRGGPRQRDRTRRSRPVRSQRAAGQGRHRPRRRRATTPTRARELPAGASSGREPAGLQRSRLACGRHGRGRRRQRGRHLLHRSVQLVHAVQAVQGRARRRARRPTCTRLACSAATGSTDVVTEAIDWAVAHKLDVINMSLGSSFGTADDSDSIAAQNAQAAGVVVVASAGNAGPNPYITGSPRNGTRRDQRGRDRFHGLLPRRLAELQRHHDGRRQRQRRHSADGSVRDRLRDRRPGHLGCELASCPAITPRRASMPPPLRRCRSPWCSVAYAPGSAKPDPRANKPAPTQSSW